MRASWLNEIGFYRFSASAYFAITSSLFLVFDWKLVLFFSVLGGMIDLLVKINNRNSYRFSIVCLIGIAALGVFIAYSHLMSGDVRCLPLNICPQTKYFDNLIADQVSPLSLLKTGILDALKLLSIAGFCFLLIAVMAKKNVASIPPMPERQRDLVLTALILVNILAIFTMAHLPNKLKYSTEIRGVSDVYVQYFIFPGGLGYLGSLLMSMLLVANSMNDKSFYGVQR